MRSATGYLKLFSIVGGVGAGVWVAFLVPQGGCTQRSLLAVWDVYLGSLLLMSIPLIGLGLVEGIANSASDLKKTWQLIGLFSLNLLVASAAGATAALVLVPGERVDRQDLGEFLVAHDADLESYVVIPPGTIVRGPMHCRIATDLAKVPEALGFPSVRFESGSISRLYIRTVLFAVLIGFVVAGLRARGDEGGALLLDIVRPALQAVLQIVNWLVLLLPVGLFALVASLDIEQLLVASRAVGLFVAAYFLAIGLTTALLLVLIKRRTTSNLRPLLWPVAIGFLAGSSPAAVPAALNSLEEILRRSKKSFEATYLLSVYFQPLGNAVYFSVAAIFLIQLEGRAGPGTVLAATILCVPASVVAAGVPGPVAAALLALVVGPIGLQSLTILPLLLALVPIVDPPFTGLNVLGSCAATTSRHAGRVVGSSAPQEKASAAG